MEESLVLKYAILGGGGCFGVNLALSLLGAGMEVIGCGRSPLREPFALGVDRLGYRYRRYTVGPENEFIVDWLDEERPDVVVNFSAQGEGAASWKARHWKFFYSTNLNALADLTERLLGKPWMQRFIQVGTSEVYGSVDKPSKEDDAVNPGSVYANSKLALDYHIQILSRRFGFPGIVVRPSNCVTPGQQLHRVVPKTFLLALTGRKLPLHGGGYARKSYMAADDLSIAIDLLALRGKIGEIYNSGPEAPIQIRDLVQICADQLGMSLGEVADVVEDRTGQEGCYWIDSSKLMALGWEPRFDLGTACADVKAWVNLNLGALKGMPTDYEMRA